MRGGSEVHTQSDGSGSVPIVRHDRAPLRRGQMARGHAEILWPQDPQSWLPKLREHHGGWGVPLFGFYFPFQSFLSRLGLWPCHTTFARPSLNCKLVKQKYPWENRNTLLFTKGKRNLSLGWRVCMFLPSVSPSQFALIAHNINLLGKKKKKKNESKQDGKSTYLISRLHPPRTGRRDLWRTPSGVSRQDGLPGAHVHPTPAPPALQGREFLAGS